jgi:hypothetical protein
MALAVSASVTTTNLRVSTSLMKVALPIAVALG